MLIMNDFSRCQFSQFVRAFLYGHSRLSRAVQGGLPKAGRERIMWHRFVFVLIIFSLLPTSMFAFADDEVAVVQMIDPIDSDVNKVGETFRATLEAPLKIGENTVAVTRTPSTLKRPRSADCKPKM